MTVPILKIAEHFADAAEPASFPQHVLRFRNINWAKQVGLDWLTTTQWVDHFSRFIPLDGNLQTPLALRYHGHQFHVYNPDLGDGRGFLFAQLRDQSGRLLDLGTKGSGQTRWSRQGDGRLTLKGGVREILAASYLEAMGVNTSKAFSLVETGEPLHRGDEPSPTRSSVLVRLSHSHIRFGSFQRAAYLNDTQSLAMLCEHVIAQYFPDCADERLSVSIPALFERITAATAKMIGQWMATGFVHGVMNTDNFNVTGESFDFGPWRFLPKSDPNFIAAYFDQQGLYRFGRQPTQGLWALQQLGSALALLADGESLSQALGVYDAAYQRSFADHTFHLLGLASGPDLHNDLVFLQSFYAWMTESGVTWPQVFFDWFGGEASAKRAEDSPQSDLYSSSAFQPIRKNLYARQPLRAERLSLPYFQNAQPVDLIHETVESLWSAIAERDDWQPFETQLAHLEQARLAYVN